MAVNPFKDKQNNLAATNTSKEEIENLKDLQMKIKEASEALKVQKVSKFQKVPNFEK